MNTTASVGIRIEDLHLSFGRHAVLKGINLDIQPGELFAFLGPSGSGKSTLLRSIAGFGPIPDGRILIDEQDIAKLPPWKRNVGMVFQSYALWPHLTVRRNVSFGLEEQRLPKKQIRQRVDRTLALVGLLDLAERRPSQLSGGQQQRVALARTIVVEPRVLLLDEPLSNLDANLRVQVRREIRDLQQQLGLTTIFVTHDQEEANTIADRMAVLDQGVIQQVGTPMQLYDKPANLFVADFLGTANVLRGCFANVGSGSEFRIDGNLAIEFDTAYPPGDGNLMFRPQNLSLAQPGAEAPVGAVRFNGTIRQREFLGALVRYEVETGQQRLLVDDNHQRGAAIFALNAAVDLFLTRDQVVVMTDTA
jgi:iron(III) transport system ATP-binding protein